LVIMAGLSSAPYLIRQKNWSEASALLEQVIHRDRSPGTIASILPLIRYIAQATTGTDRELIDAGIMAKSLHAAGRLREAEDILRSLITGLAAKHEFWSASVATGDLFNIIKQTGPFEEALKLAEEKRAYTRQAGLGPWTQLMDEAFQLMALNCMGRCDEVLKVVEELRVQIRSLPERTDQDEKFEPWYVKEFILNVGQKAAMRLDKIELALELNAELIDDMKSRDAPDLVLAGARFNYCVNLLRLKRYDEAWRLLWACKAVFEKERSFESLDAVFDGLAHLMDKLGDVEQAISFEKTALRYSYIFGEAENVIIIQRNLAYYLGKTGSQSAMDHWLAEAIIGYQIGSAMLPSILSVLAYYLVKFGPEALPGSFDQLVDRLEQVDGVSLRELFHRLAWAQADGDRVMLKVIEMAKDASPESRPDMA
jgi:tetratricopeptide (TPR) repeat protein